MAIKGVIFDNQTPSAKQMAAIFQPVVKDGILRGCSIGYNGSDIIVGVGEMIACGRPIEFNTQQRVAASGTGYVRLIVNLDMDETATTEEFTQVYLSTETAEQESGFTELTKEDINGTGRMYQVEMARFTITADNITEKVSELVSVTMAATRLLIGGTEYELQIGTAEDAAAGYITIVIET